MSRNSNKRKVNTVRPNTSKAKRNLVNIDKAATQFNQEETLKYFSNISTVRELCTKEQLNEFVELMKNQGEPIMKQMDDDRAFLEASCPRRRRYNNRMKEDEHDKYYRIQMLKETLLRLKNMPVSKISKKMELMRRMDTL